MKNCKVCNVPYTDGICLQCGKRQRRPNGVFGFIIKKYKLLAYEMAAKAEAPLPDKAWRLLVAKEVESSDAAKIRETRIDNRKNAPNPIWRRSGVRAESESVEMKIKRGRSYIATMLKDRLKRNGYLRNVKRDGVNYICVTTKDPAKLKISKS